MKYSLLTLLLLFVFSLNSQEKRKPLHLATSNIAFGENLEDWLNLEKTALVQHNDWQYLLIQFSKIPLESDKENWLQHGIHLLHYIPDYAWYVKINRANFNESFNRLPIVKFSPIVKEWKTSPELIQTFAASQGDKVAVKILPIESAELSNIELLARAMNVNQVEKEYFWLNSKINNTQFEALLAHPLIKYIELQETEPEEESILLESQITMSSYISDNPGKQLFFNGDGVKIGINEADAVALSENPDYRSRINRSFEGNNITNNHKTNVARRMASSGNIDPINRGAAFGATLYSGGLDFQTSAQTDITLINRSVGWGCPTGTANYNAFAGFQDFLVRTYPTFTVSYSAGNIGSTECYAGFTNWGNITGLNKMAKNIFVVGAINYENELTNFSSRGPAKDGRILPNLVTVGPGGTSHASPNLSGVFAQLNQVYRFHNNGIIPESGLLKAVLMNTCDDIENPGPDFQTGYGKINARRAHDVIANGYFESNTVSHSDTNVHLINCPAGLKELKIMLYWTDYEATAGISSKTLVNDLDLTVKTPSGQSLLPWVLNPDFNLLTINAPAQRAIDTLNNTEQVTIKNPASGSYEITVKGSTVPQGPQKYFLTYEYVEDEIIVTYPKGGEKFIINETERIRWNAPDSNLTFNLYYSTDNGNNWQTIATGVASEDRFFNWTIPNSITSEALVRVERGSISGESDANFHIFKEVNNLELIWSCADSSLLHWDAITGADGYMIYKIIGDYMDSLTYTSNNSIILNNLSMIENEYIAVSPIKNNAIGRRCVALTRPPSNINCISNDVSIKDLINPGIIHIPLCMFDEINNFEIELQNLGVNSITNIPVAYQVNNAPIVHDTVLATINSGNTHIFSFNEPLSLGVGNHNLTFWSNLPGDPNTSNDTLTIELNIYPSSIILTDIWEENFDDFQNCSVAWGCESISCSLADDWFNVPNEFGDDIDWRTHNFSTETAQTGPTADYPTGQGKYLYLEGSGNGGSGCQFRTALLQSPCIDLTSAGKAYLNFWYHAFGSNIGELRLDVVVNGKLTKDIMPAITGNQGDQWFEANVDLSSFVGNKVMLVFRGSTANGFRSDLAIDFITMTTAPKIDFTVSDTLVCKDQLVHLENTSIGATNYEWTIQPSSFQLAQGTSLNSFEPILSFLSPGFYSIQLNATNSQGVSDSLVKSSLIEVIELNSQLITSSDFCPNNPILIESDNAGFPITFYLNNVSIQHSLSNFFEFQNLQTDDQIWTEIFVNSNCTLISDTLNVTITEVDTSVVLQNTGLLANNQNANAFQWLDCNLNYAMIPDAVHDFFEPDLAGVYAVQVQQDGCIDTSACHVFDLSENTLTPSGTFQVFPNPNHGVFTVDFGEIYSNVDLTIYNTLGQKIWYSSYSDMLLVDLDISNFAAGVYTIEKKVGSHRQSTKIIKL